MKSKMYMCSMVMAVLLGSGCSSRSVEEEREVMKYNGEEVQIIEKNTLPLTRQPSGRRIVPLVEE